MDASSGAREGGGVGTKPRGVLGMVGREGEAT